MKEVIQIPELRFSDFNDEWKVSEIGDYISERKVPASNNLPLYSLTIEQGVVPKSKRYERSFLVNNKDDAYKEMQPGDFAFNPMNLRFGALAMLKDNVKVAVSKYYNIFYCNENAEPSFFESYLTRYNMVQYYDRMSSGTLEEKKRVHYLDFIHFKKPIPALPEQQKIASFLSTVDKKIEQLTRKKELLEQYKKGVMQKLFSQEIRFKDDNGQDYPGWKEKRLGDIADFKKGKGISKSDISNDGTLKCIRYGELYTKYKEVIESIVSATNVDAKGLELSVKNDVLIPSSGETHIDLATASCVVIDGVALGGDINIIRSKQDGVFLAYYLNYGKKYDIAKLAQGMSVIHLYSTHLKSLRLLLPSIEEQQNIAKFIISIDKKITFIQTQLTQTQKFKKGLLQKMFV